MPIKRPVYYQDADQCVDDIIKEIGHEIVFAMPLALGKPIQLINALYRRAKADPQIKLTIMTALSLEKPTWSSDLERRFLKPFVERIWKDIPDFDYILDLRKGQMPSNIELKEFYYKAGQFISLPEVQQNHINSNYTHAARDSVDGGLNVFGNIIAKRVENGQTLYSMSCNADTPLDGLAAMRTLREQGKKTLSVGQVNTNLPFMYGDAVVTPERYDMILECPEYNFPLFSVPRPVVSGADHMIGIHASTLIKDGGTLQIGIGALGDAITAGLQLRQEHNDLYQEILQKSAITDNFGHLIDRIGGTRPFVQGLYGSTEMFVDGFLQLYKMGILKRRVYHHAALQRLLNNGLLKEKITARTIDILVEHGVIQAQLTAADVVFLKHFGIFKDEVRYADGALTCDGQTLPADLGEKSARKNVSKVCLGRKLQQGVILTGAFFIGPNDFYQDLRNMSEEERRPFEMTSVLKANQLYGGEELRALQRKDGRFINTGMVATLFGNIASDMLEDGTMISGVGGQYNFVSMAHALPDGRAIILIKSTRAKGKQVSSNIVFNYGHVTIPRHLRDIVVTEYGIADLRGKSNKEIVAAMINVADSRFQDELLQKAKSLKRLPRDYRIPDQFRGNTPQRLEDLLAPYRKQGHFKAFPFGSDLTDDEIVLGKSLRKLKESIADKDLSMVPALLAQLLKSAPEKARPYLQRMELDQPASTAEKILQKLIIFALSSAGQI